MAYCAETVASKPAMSVALWSCQKYSKKGRWGVTC